METIQHQENKSWYDRQYNLLLFIPIILLIASLVYLGFFYSQHNDLIYKDVSLSGGTSVTVQGDIDSKALESSLKEKFSDVSFRKLTEINTGKPIALIIESSAGQEELKLAIENLIGFNLTNENSSIEFSGPVLSQSFYQELLKIVFLSFILMALVIFLIFGVSTRIKAVSFGLSLAAVKLTFPASTLLGIFVFIVGISALLFGIYKSKNKKEYLFPAIAILILIISFIFPIYYFIFPVAILLFLTYLTESIPSVAVIFAAFSDIIFALAIVDLLEVRLSAAGIAAFLMLIGYSVDTDILLTTRALRKKDSTLNLRIYGAFKTGIFMTLTALAAVLPAFFIITGLPDSFRQIFLILALGLFADILNTWLTNAGIIKWYCQRKGIK